MENFIRILCLCVLSISLSACSGVLPVPGGKNTINNAFYQSNVELKQKLSLLKPGMTTEEVFDHLGRTPDELIKLNRSQIIDALYGGSNSPYATGAAVNPYKAVSIKSLSAYELNYGIIKRKHGLKSPISIRTDEVGYDYSATIVFKDDALFEEPLVSGGLINNSSSTTVFDNLSPSMVMNRL